jgi:hypothetical protein
VGVAEAPAPQPPGQGKKLTPTTEHVITLTGPGRSGDSEQSEDIRLAFLNSSP